jgi:N-acetyl-D-muramate 6-phosphate phosphatase
VPASPERPGAILFDLDGTLLDTAPDMTGALNALLIEQGRDELPFAAMRAYVSHGSHGLVRLAFGDDDPVRFENLRQRFLALYAARLCEGTRLFDGMPELLDAIESADCVWGIVTNKPGWLTDPLLKTLGLDARAGCVVSGDTYPERKPHPMPLLRAAAALQVAPEQCLYIGDAERDVVAATRAGMPVVVARYGYIGAHDDLTTWPPHDSIDEPLDLLAWLQSRQDAPSYVRAE